MNVDVVIVGGGMVGAATALALAQNGWQVALIEQVVPKTFDVDEVPDVRISAISYRSIQLLKTLQVWDLILAMRSTPYRQLEVWENEDAHAIFHADSVNISELGYMVENRIIQLATWQQFSNYSNLHLLAPSTIKEMKRIGNAWQVILDNDKVLTAPLLVGADGANSKVRDAAGIMVTGWQYEQHCMLITVKTDAPTQETTWQQFFKEGPRAFLPLYDNWACLVWYDTPSRIRQLKALSVENLTKEITTHFPSRLGKVEPIGWDSFPLIRRHAQNYVKEGVVLLGDAAHTIHPLAGQGVNLGYRDVEVLLNVLNNARDKAEDWSSLAVLNRYERRRYLDNLLMQSSMDAFYCVFRSELPIIKFLRNVGLKTSEHSGKLKTWALKYAIGM